ncbi:hypothetical protein [Pseudolysinimonas sp.]|jgi:hypothetical protein|uniref:hypothetical protein n=1 Tax=Pseudolysinimonas sp. TaxID=2680009 RepID=UPI003784EF0E
MRRRKLPSTRFAVVTAAVLTVVGLAGCATGGPAPSPTASESASPSATAPVTVDPTQQPTTVDALPGSAFLRVSATAEVGDEEVRLQLTFARAQTGVAAPDDFAAVQEECANAITSQLEIYPLLEPTGVISSQLAMVGDWPEGMTVAVVAGGIIASFGDGTNVAPTEDAVGMFGCTVPIVTGPGSAEFVSLLLGDPAVSDRTDLEQQIALGSFGFESDSGSAVEVRWRDCVIQLSSAAQRIATASGWTQQTQGNFGCLIGDEGTV